MKVFSKHLPSGPMLSISRNVRLSVCPPVRPSVRPSVCSLLRYRLNVFLPSLPKVKCPICLEIRNPWGKVMERSGLIFEHFCLKIVKNRRAKKSLFFADFALQNMVETTLLMIFSVFKKNWVFCILGPPGNHASLWIRDLWSKGVSLILTYL